MDSLAVSAPVGLSDEAEQQIEDYWSTIDGVLVDLHKQGFIPVRRPPFAPPEFLPIDFSQLTAERFYLLQAQYEAWKSYAAYNQALLKCGIEECKNSLKVLPAEVRKTVRNQYAEAKERKPSNDAIDDEVITHPRYIELLNRLQRLEQTKELIDHASDSYSRKIQILSRTLELRRQELEVMGKGAMAVGTPRRNL